METKNCDNDEDDSSGEKKRKDILQRLYDPERQQRRDLWQFIKLVSPYYEEGKVWKSKEAAFAYCLRCERSINYTAGTSQQILRHMIRFHPQDLNNIPASAIASTNNTSNDSPVNNNTDDDNGSEPLSFLNATAINKTTYSTKRNCTPTAVQAKKKRKQGEKPKAIPFVQQLHMDEECQKHGNLLLLKWLLTESPSSQCDDSSLSIVENTGFINFCNFLLNRNPSTYSLPTSQNEMIQFLQTIHQRVLKTILKHIHNPQNCKYYSITSSTTNTTNGHQITLVLHYVTSTFEMQHISVPCITTDTTVDNDTLLRFIEESLLSTINNHNLINPNTISKKSNGTEQAVSIEHLVMHVHTSNTNTSEEKEKDFCNHSRFPCVVHTLLDILQQTFLIPNQYNNLFTNAIQQLRQIVINWNQTNTNPIPFNDHDEFGRKHTNTTSFYWSSITTLLHMIKCCLEERLQPAFQSISSNQWFLLENTYQILQYFHDAIQTLLSTTTTETTSKTSHHEDNMKTTTISPRNYPSWPFTFSMLRMLKLFVVHFETQPLSSSPSSKNDNLTDNSDDENHENMFQGLSLDFPKELQMIQAIRKNIIKEFYVRFQSIETFMLWTVLLDPRLTNMNGFSTQEQITAKQELLQQMKNIPPSQKTVLHRSHQDNLSKEKNESFFLKQIFAKPLQHQDFIIHGNKNDKMTKNQNLPSTNNGSSISEEMELDQYLFFCNKYTIIRDPLQWWKVHQDAFPSLSWLSRKWLSAVSTTVSSSSLVQEERLNKTTKRNLTSYPHDQGHQQMLAFVRDNLHLIS